MFFTPLLWIAAACSLIQDRGLPMPDSKPASALIGGQSTLLPVDDIIIGAGLIMTDTVFFCANDRLLQSEFV